MYRKFGISAFRGDFPPQCFPASDDVPYCKVFSDIPQRCLSKRDVIRNPDITEPLSKDEFYGVEKI